MDYILQRQRELERMLYNARRSHNYTLEKKVRGRMEELRRSVINNNQKQKNNEQDRNH